LRELFWLAIFVSPNCKRIAEHPQQVLDFFMQGVTGRSVQNCTLRQTDAVGGDDA
jgi:hypothetical protein